MKTQRALAFAFACIFCIVAANRTDAHTPTSPRTAPHRTHARSKPSAATMFGTFYNCQPEWNQNRQKPEAACDAQLASMAQVGFSFVVNYGTFSETGQQLVDLVNAGNALGIQHSVSLVPLYWWEPGGQNGQQAPFCCGSGTWADTYPGYYADCNANWAGGCNSIDDVVKYTVHITKNLPGTWGYYIDDEEPAQEASAVAAIVADIRSEDQVKPTWCGQFAWSGESAAEMNNYVAAYAGLCNYFASDFYPYGLQGKPAFQRPSSTTALAAVTQQVATKNGMGYGFEIQSFAQCQDGNWLYGQNPQCAWYGYEPYNPAPTEKQMAQQQQWVFAGMPTPWLVMRYSYYDIIRSDDPCGHWDDMVLATFGLANAPCPAPPGSSGPLTH